MSNFTLLGWLAVLLGCACFYLSSDNQRWLVSSFTALPARIAAAVLLGLGWLGLAHEMHAVTASFVFVTTLMLAFSIFPYVAALLGILRKQ